jgi:ketosteroid isomerase-like protein
MFSRVIGATALVLTFAWCQTTPQQKEKRDVAPDVAAINALNDKVTAAFNSNDAAAMAATVTDDAILMLPNEVTVEGKQKIQALFETRFKSKLIQNCEYYA